MDLPINFPHSEHSIAFNLCQALHPLSTSSTKSRYHLVGGGIFTKTFKESQQNETDSELRDCSCSEQTRSAKCEVTIMHSM